MAPFGPYDDFPHCVSENSGKANPEAFCAWLHREITGEFPTSANSAMPKEAFDIYIEHYAKHLKESKENVSVSEKAANDFAITELSKVGWKLARMGWVHQFEAPKMRNVLGVKVFATGEWTDSKGETRTWTEQDLDKMVEAFNAGVPAISPLKAGHTPDTFNDAVAKELGVPVALVTGLEGEGQVTLGRMSTLERRGPLLIASFEMVPDKVANLIDGGQYATVSVEIEDKVGDFGPVLTATAMLGAETPAVDVATLDRAMVFGGPRQGARVFTFSTKENVPLVNLENEFSQVHQKFNDAIKGMRGAPVFRALFTQLQDLFKRMTDKMKAEHTDPKAGKFTDGGNNMGDVVKLADKTAELATLFAVTPEEVIALIASLGLPPEAGIQDLAKLIEELKAKSGGMPGESSVASFSAMATSLKESQTQIEKLTDGSRHSAWLFKADTLKHSAGTPEELATELTAIEKASGLAVADRVFASYKMADDAQAQLFQVNGTTRSGAKDIDLDNKVAEYQKEHADATRSVAVKAVLRANASLYREAVRETRRIAALNG